LSAAVAVASIVASHPASPYFLMSNLNEADILYKNIQKKAVSKLLRLSWCGRYEICLFVLMTLMFPIKLIL